jgi:hypothetical protein
MSAEILRRAAELRNAPPRLLRAADAVLDGKFSWEDVASGRCEHPKALALFTAKAQETLWPLLREVAEEIDSDKPEHKEPTAQRYSEIDADEDYYDQFSILRPAFEQPE